MKWFSVPRPGNPFPPRRKASRARRLKLLLPVRFRAPGREWQMARMENLSATGALVESASAGAQPGQELELRFDLPRQLVGRANVPMQCLVRVARVESVAEGHSRIGLELLRGSPLSARRAPSSAVGWAETMGDVRHDVNNCLTAILGAAELLLLKGVRDEQERAQLVTIRDLALRAASSLHRLRDPAA